MFSAISNIPLALPHLGFPFKKSSSPSSSSSSTTPQNQAIKIPRVQVHDVEITSDKRGRRLKHLLKLNHATFSILYNRLRFHNHTPHILGSAYLLGGTADHLTAIYEDAATNEGHEHWTESPSEIAEHDYRDFLGRREFQRAFVDFFEDELVQHGYDWKDVVAKFLFERGDPQKTKNVEPIFNCLTAGLGHPLIHLGYAYELNSREVAMEALGLAATCYDGKLAEMFESKSPKTDVAVDGGKTTDDLFELFSRVHNDTRLDSAFDHFGGDNLSHLLADPKLTSILLEHWHSWKIDNATRAFEQSQALATALLISTSSHPSIGGHGYDFFIVHLLTTSHAVRILISFLDARYHVPLVREWLLITLAIYIAQLRPEINRKFVTEYELQGRDWDNFVVPAAVQGKHKFDAHFVKACRAMKEAEKIWGAGGDENEYGKDYWLKAAVRFATEFDGWGGFGPADEVEVRELREQKQEQQQQEDERKRQSQATG
ncbi:hypothetical protein HRR83_009122 [Exophiala dermatitidis]|uniref:Apoptosis regulator Bcl-2 family BH4 domain-containing protein n=2 Tax=Exophiala dermatitidis TaxID=5970 RepID=H6CAJ5_EXODN|nr:uncharacterized protein HMPREF1120_08130 [Exophiala dermatitidis NIH/UT8656]KAJ4504401.1 hypothetical protein HRR74_009047 [Exophiala dermatitidis]EHY60159.1 hypothetical protein HMPREF1120_08130 [Exophiala dermatitidis NIH/UT8656]KAJ4504829.1 hypothetical protein HRR73_008583 [Exophiala dermatitidis]KAJ4530720.1 hypothetical protein HRR76_008418 [Exophiala dermatitidis]KAJ4531675.1 hypothetical protein HRR77_009221 [Exophiala dermatitidis]